MKIYAVGGAVRDELLGLPIHDRDFVVVGASVEQMVAQGFKPVGKDFPVFLHPKTHEEYALARTERKTAPGYQGFVFHTATNVSLEDDLRRRDLTINAMARDEAGRLIDPFSGEADLNHRLLRHVSDAFVEDPVRILRVARFAARLSPFGFRVADETLELMRHMVESGEVDHLVAERVWLELSRGLMTPKPSIMFEVLRDCGALRKILPEVERLFGVPQSASSHPEIDTGIHVMMVLDQTAKREMPLAVRYAALMHDLGKGTTPAQFLPRHPDHENRGLTLVKTVGQRLRVGSDCHDLALLTTRWHGEVHAALDLNTERLLSLLRHTDALRRPQRFGQLIDACACDHHGRLGYDDVPYPQAQHLREALICLQAVDQGRVAAQHASTDIAAAVERAKRAALQQFLDQTQPA